MATRPPPSPTSGGTASRGDWRADVRSAGRLNVLAGIWLVVSPFILAYGGFWLADTARAEWNSWALGGLVILFSTASASTRQAPPPPVATSRVVTPNDSTISQALPERWPSG